jgi:hypothetical protein
VRRRASLPAAPTALRSRVSLWGTAHDLLKIQLMAEFVVPGMKLETFRVKSGDVVTTGDPSLLGGQGVSVNGGRGGRSPGGEGLV